MILYAQCSYPMARLGMKLSFRMGASGHSPRFARLCMFDTVVPPSCFVPLSMPPARLPAAGPLFARIACARVRASRAGAHIARLIARTRGKRRAHVSRPFLRGFFAPAQQETKRPHVCRFLSHPITDFTGSSPFRRIISNFMNKMLSSVMVRPVIRETLPSGRPHPRPNWPHLRALCRAPFPGGGVGNCSDRRELRKTAAGDWNSNIYHLDGLVERIRNLEPDFAEAKEEGREARRRAETPVGRRGTDPRKNLPRPRA